MTKAKDQQDRPFIVGHIANDRARTVKRACLHVVGQPDHVNGHRAIGWDRGGQVFWFSVKGGCMIEKKDDGLGRRTVAREVPVEVQQTALELQNKVEAAMEHLRKSEKELEDYLVSCVRVAVPARITDAEIERARRAEEARQGRLRSRRRRLCRPS